MALVDELNSIGFTEYEAKVYLALLRENPATGYQVSKNAGVPRSMVYEALGRLDVRGAVLKTDDRRATLYRPVPPNILLDRYQREQQQVINSLRTNLNALFEPHQGDYFWKIQGRSAVLSFCGQMLAQAAEEILIVAGDADLENLRQTLTEAHQRGVAISALLTGKDELGYGQVVHHPPLESEAQELTRMLVVVADNRQALISNNEMEMTATITSNRNLVLIARQFVWMELFAQRIYSRLGPDLLNSLEKTDRQMLEVYAQTPGGQKKE